MKPIVLTEDEQGFLLETLRNERAWWIDFGQKFESEAIKEAHASILSRIDSLIKKAEEAQDGNG